MDLTPDEPLGERDKDMNTLPTETVGTTHQRVSLQCMLFLSLLRNKSRDLTHPLSHPTVSYERELHSELCPAYYGV